MTEAFLVGGVRTPMGRYGGTLSGVRPDDLAALVLAEAVARTGVDPEAIDMVLFGAANQAGEDNRNVARMASLLAGLPDHVPGVTVNQLCASGLAAVTLAAQSIKAGEAELVLAGGVESMSRAPWVTAKPTKAFARPGEIADTSIGWRFTNPRFLKRDKATYSMTETAEEVADLDRISRDDADAVRARLAPARRGRPGCRALRRRNRGRGNREGCRRRRRRTAAGHQPRRLGTVALDRQAGRRGHRRQLAARSTTAPRRSSSPAPTRSSGTGCGRGPASSAARAPASRPQVMGLGPVPATTKLLQRLGWASTTSTPSSSTRPSPPNRSRASGA